MSTTWTAVCDLETQLETAERLGEALAEGQPYTVTDLTPMRADETDIRHYEITVYLEDRPDEGRLKTRFALATASLGCNPIPLRFVELPDLDWVAHVYEGFPPVSAGRFYVYGSHIETPPPVHATGLKIDAATAFGTGQHGSTLGCLLALDMLRKKSAKPTACLDVGTGTGILALAMAKAFACQVTASDIDPRAIRLARENIAQNGMQHRIRCITGDGPAPRALRRPDGYGVVTANILARPLIRMAGNLSGHLGRGGFLILSGLTKMQANRVEAAYRARGLTRLRRVSVGDWRTLMFRRP